MAECLVAKGSGMHSVNNRPLAHPASTTQWKSPPAGIFKVNYDGSLFLLQGSISAVWIIRDSQGTYLLSGSSKLKQDLIDNKTT